jgi:hypothetical protein
MSRLFTITPDIRKIGEQAINDLIDNLGRQCKVIYESETAQVCNNCFFDSANQRSTGKYNGTGPRAFASGKCPVCRGTGYLPNTTESSDTLTLLIDWQPKEWAIIDRMVTLQGAPPAGGKIGKGNMVMVKGYIADMPKVIQAKYIILDYPNAQYENNRFILWGEPVVQGNIIQTKYFNAYMTRMGN